AADDARVLILGSMPGVKSLEAGEYYAHPRNAFWPVMAELLGIQVFENYHEKTALLLQSRIALWDVLQHCIRPGSLDSAIKDDTIVTNDFEGFFNMHRQISHVFFNGGKAEMEFLKRVRPVLPEQMKERLSFTRLPSTSPAMASLSTAQKVLAWQCVKEALR
ncbi:MAG: DNA-deoxyinosine glycosylase, partial [Alphaproteobacteria bacterium]